MPEGWAWCRLGEIANIARGGSPRPIQDYITNAENGINWIKIGDTAENSKYISSAKEKIKPEGIKHSRFVHSGDFLLTNSMSFGRPYILKIDGCIHDGWLVFANIKECLNQDYLYYILSSKYIYETFSHIAVGSTVKNLKSDTVKQVLFPLPSISEQNRIVESVDKIFTIIKSIEQNKSILQDSIKQAKSKILDLAIHGKLVPQNPNDEPAEEFLKHIATGDNRPYEKVGEEPFEIPHSWKWVRLGSVCDYGKCINVSTSDLRANDWILDLEDIEKDSGKILAFHTLKERKSESTKHKFTKGQVLYSKLRPYLNKVVIAPKDGFCTSEILPLDFNEILLNRFAQIVLMSSYFLTLVNMVTYGVKMPRLGTGDAKNMLIPIPPLNEQKRIVSKIDELFSNLDQIQNNLI